MPLMLLIISNRRRRLWDVYIPRRIRQRIGRGIVNVVAHFVGHSKGRRWMGTRR